jgi:DNA-binding GntR family transcriptional regulator
MLVQSEATLLAPAPSSAADRLSQRAYQAIRVALRSGELRPGQRLILRPLAAKLGLSATPVREALLRLVSEQALGLDERNSVLVPTLGAEELTELRELRLDLEGRAAAVLAERATELQIQVIEDIQAGLRDAVERGDRAEMLARNDAFHHEILARSNRPTLVRVLDALQVRFGPLNAMLESFGDRITADHPHERMIEAFRAHDPAAARAAMVADIEASFQNLRTALTTPVAA